MISTGKFMKKLILFFIVVLIPSYSWALCEGKNYCDISMTNLTEKKLINA